MKVFKVVEDEWVLNGTTRLFGLVIREQARLSAPEGKQLTMTLNGENVPIVPGTYEGDIVLTITDDISIHAVCDAVFRSALYVEDGKIVPEKSVLAAVVGGTVEDGGAKDIAITSSEDDFNGVIVAGEGEYTIDNAEIHFRGNGSNDFVGQGAGIMTTGTGKLTINNSHLTTYGAARGTIFGGERGTLVVNDCVIEGKPGILPADYVDSIEPGGMRCVPWMLGLRGNCRATNLADYTTAYFNRCTCISESWGVMSTDGVNQVRSYIKDCDIRITGTSGYGAFALLDTVVTLDHSTIHVPDYGMVSSMANATFVVKNGTVVNAGRFGGMSYRLVDGLFDIQPGCEIHAGETAFLTKGCPCTYQIDHAAVTSGRKILLQMMDTDDPFNPKGSYSDPVDNELYIEGRDLTKALRGEDCFVILRDTEIEGSIYNATSDLKFEFIPLKPLPGEPGGPPLEPLPDGTLPKFSKMMGNGPMNLSVSLEGAALTGSITSAKAYHRVPKIDKTNCEELGEVNNTPRPAVNNGVVVEIDGTSKWIVEGTNYLNKLILAEGAKVLLPDGGAPTMTVDGVPTEIKAGTYVGRIVIA